MLVLTESEIKKNQRQLIGACINQIFSHLSTGQELFETFFPNAIISVVGDDEAVKYSATKVIKAKNSEIEKWINEVLENALVVYEEIESEEKTPKSINLPGKMRQQILTTLLEVLTCGRDLRDNDYYFLSDVSLALRLEPSYVLKTIEQVQYEIRRMFFDSLLEYLTDEQCFQSAVLLYKAIQADNQIHPAEFKYIENINQLLRNDQSRLEEVEKAVQRDADVESLDISDELARHLFKYLVEIVLCDQDFDPKESEYVNHVAEILGFDKTKRDEILQPIAATLMVKESLFPKMGS